MKPDSRATVVFVVRSRFAALKRLGVFFLSIIYDISEPTSAPSSVDATVGWQRNAQLSFLSR